MANDLKQAMDDAGIARAEILLSDRVRSLVSRWEDPAIETAALGAIRELQRRNAELLDLLGEALPLLNSDAGLDEDLGERITALLPPPPDPPADDKAEPCRPRAGEKVISSQDPDMIGVVTGPSEYQGGVMVRFSKSLRYPCSVQLLEVVDRTPNKSEEDDFEAWLYMQSNVARDCQDLALLTRRWRLDFAWHDNPRDTYRSKA